MKMNTYGSTVELGKLIFLRVKIGLFVQKTGIRNFRERRKQNATVNNIPNGTRHMVVYYLRFFVIYSIQLHRKSKQSNKKTKKILI